MGFSYSFLLQNFLIDVPKCCGYLCVDFMPQNSLEFIYQFDSLWMDSPGFSHKVSSFENRFADLSGCLLALSLIIVLWLRHPALC